MEERPRDDPGRSKASLDAGNNLRVPRVRSGPETTLVEAKLALTLATIYESLAFVPTKNAEAFATGN